MRSFTFLLIAGLLAAGILPAAADPDATPDPSTSSASPSPEVSSASPPPPDTTAVYPVFNYPTKGNPDPAINGELTRLLNGVPTGGQVSAALFVVAPTYPVVDALINAHLRGVAVRVVIDSGRGQTANSAQAISQTIAKLSAALGRDTTATSFLVECVDACISKLPDTINHNKFVAMSTTGDLQNVVFQSTANIRSDGSGDAAWNAATVSSGNAELYGSYLTYFGNLSARISVPNNDYNAVQPPQQLGRFKPYYFPRTDGIDSVSQTLMGVNCSLAPTTVNVMAAFFTRPKVRNRLNEMAGAGCTVRVIARTDSITREFCDSLRPPIQIKISDKPSPTAVGIHGKYITIDGGFESTSKRLVWMGSENLTKKALIANDETFLLIDQADVHSAFVTNFNLIWDYPTLTSGCGRAGGVSEEEIEEEADQETTPLIKEAQTVGRKLPARLRKRTELRSTLTRQGQPLTTTVICRVKGTSQKYKARAICDLRTPRKNPTVVLKPKKRQVLKVRISQKAAGTATLEKFSRRAEYRYRR